MSETYYEVLGVEPGASRDAIREAYRARVIELSPDDWQGDAEVRRQRSAAVNKAWNVLSDPFQKERYDLALEEGSDPDADERDDDSASTAGASGSAAGGRVTDARRAQVRVGPGGIALAPTRSRINGLAIDVAVMIVISFVVSFVAANFYHDAIEVKVNGDIVKTVDVDGRDVSQLEASLKADAAAKYAKDHPKDKKAPKVTAKKVQIPSTAVIYASALAILLLGLLYAVPLTLRNGQTLGKRLFKTRLVAIDGSRAGVANAVLHYGVPLSVAVAFPQLGPLGPLAAIGMILWSIRDRSGQGVNDKLAKTLVVPA